MIIIVPQMKLKIKSQIGLNQLVTKPGIKYSTINKNKKSTKLTRKITLHKSKQNSPLLLMKLIFIFLILSLMI